MNNTQRHAFHSMFDVHYIEAITFNSVQFMEIEFIALCKTKESSYFLRHAFSIDVRDESSFEMRTHPTAKRVMEYILERFSIPHFEFN